MFISSVYFRTFTTLIWVSSSLCCIPHIVAHSRYMFVDSDFGSSPAHQPFNLLVSVSALIVNVLSARPAAAVAELVPLLPPLIDAIGRLREGNDSFCLLFLSLFCCYLFFLFFL